MGAECGCEITCLIVDDNILNLIPLEAMLDQLAGIKVMKALSGSEAIEMY